MNKLFKDIRHNDIEAVRKAISKNPAVVNEIYDAKEPKRDIGASPLQVAVECGRFEIIDILLKNGADVNFMENIALVPPDTLCASALYIAIIGVFDSLCFKNYERSEKTVQLIETLLKKGSDPNQKSTAGYLPIGLAMHKASMILERESVYPEIQKITKKRLFEVLDLLIKYGANVEKWLVQTLHGSTNREYYLDKNFTFEYIDRIKPIRKVVQQYFKIYNIKKIFSFKK